MKVPDTELLEQLNKATQKSMQKIIEHFATAKAWQSVQHLVAVRHCLKETSPIASAKKDRDIPARGYRLESEGRFEDLALEVEKIYDGIIGSLELMIDHQSQSDGDLSEELFPVKGLIH